MIQLNASVKKRSISFFVNIKINKILCLQWIASFLIKKTRIHIYCTYFSGKVSRKEAKKNREYLLSLIMMEQYPSQTNSSKMTADWETELFKIILTLSSTTSNFYHFLNDTKKIKKGYDFTKSFRQIFLQLLT